MAGKDTDDLARRWQEAQSPAELLGCLERLRPSDRKLRLAMCAALRRLWPLLLDERSRGAVAAVERFADGLIGDSEHRARGREALDAYNDSRPDGHDPGVANAALIVTYQSPPHSGREAAAAVFEDCRAACARNRHLGLDPEAEQEAHCRILRCVFGDPFRPEAPGADGWRAWGGGAAGHLARVIYDERRFGELPVLADALEEAGCAEPAVLAHCREPADHVRGCWVVDLVLGRQ
jgi:hypothetical protein